MTFVLNIVSLVALTSLSSCYLPLTRGAADDSTRIRDIVDTAIHPLMVEYDVPGMAVAITIAGQPHFFNYGVASRESGTPVNEETLFEIGSVSKTFTGTLAAYAQVRGKLSLDDRPGPYMPQLQGSAINQVSLHCASKGLLATLPCRGSTMRRAEVARRGFRCLLQA